MEDVQKSLARLSQTDLEVLKALNSFPEGASGPEVTDEASIPYETVNSCLKHLKDVGLVTYSNRTWRVNDLGRQTAHLTEGKTLLRCLRCKSVELVPEVTVGEYKKLRHSCGYPYEYIRHGLRPDKKPEFPSKPGTPPTRLNRRGQVVYTYEPYERGGLWFCGAKQADGTPCERISYHDNHRCRYHGGTKKGHLVTGRYSKHLTRTLRELYDEFRNDPELLDLRDEIALLRAKLVQDQEESVRSLAAVADTIGKLAGRVIEREEGLKLHISVDRLNVVVAAITQVIVEELRVCPHCGEPLDDLRARISDAIANLRLFEKPKEERW